MAPIRIYDVQKDWRCLDTPEFEILKDVRLVSHEKFTSCPEFVVDYIPPNRITKCFRFSSILFEILYSFQLLRAAGKRAVLILNGGSGGLWLFVGLLNRFFTIRKRQIFLWDVFVEVEKSWKKAIMRAAIKGFRLAVLWSKDQIPSHSRFLNMPEACFVFLPFKANHSQGPHYDLPMGNFIFAGGNSKRDYKCLVDAVRGSNIPVIISVTAPEVRRQIEHLLNVIVLSAPEPAFAQLQASSRFVVIPMIPTGIRGGGEANFCNAMWHGKPVIVADNISAKDYILEGETGYVVPASDSEALRRRILDLWNDPRKVQQMGEAARRHVEKNFMHVQFIRRLLRLAMLVGDAEGIN